MIMINNNLRLFIRAAEKGSFTSAANDMFISQPAVSRAIKTLEGELNVRLFFRDRRKGLILTEAGRAILLQARQMEDMENRIYQIAFRENNFLGGKVRIATMPILTSVILSKVLYTFKNKYPHVAIEITEGTSLEIRRDVEEHRVDFGFTSSPFGDLDYEIVLTDRIVSVYQKPYEGVKPTDLTIDCEKYILCHAGYETVLELLRQKKVRLERSLVVQQAESVISLVKEGNGVGIISELVLDSTPNNLYRNAVTPSVEISIGVVANDLFDMTPVAAEFLRLIKDECQKYRSSVQMRITDISGGQRGTP